MKTMSTVGATVDRLPGVDSLSSVPRPLEIPRQPRVYGNRNLRLDKIEMVGFDMDYTLAIYDQARIEELSMRCTLDKLVQNLGYTEEIRHLQYDPALAFAAWSSIGRTATSSSPTATGFPDACATGWPTSIATRWPPCTSASASCCPRRASPGSTRCSRCPRRCCTAGWSITSITAARRSTPRRCGRTS